MNWIWYGLAAAGALGCADLLIKHASGKLPNSLGMLLYALPPFLCGVVWTLMDRSKGVSFATAPGVMVAGLGVGLMFAIVTFGMYAAFSAGAPVSVASPLIRLGGLLLASVVGVLIWREAADLRYALGVLLVCAGLFLIVSR